IGGLKTAHVEINVGAESGHHRALLDVGHAAVGEDEVHARKVARRLVEQHGRSGVEGEIRTCPADVDQHRKPPLRAYLVEGIEATVARAESAGRIDFITVEAVVADAAFEQIDAVPAPAWIDAGEDEEAARMPFQHDAMVVDDGRNGYPAVLDRVGEVRSE